MFNSRMILPAVSVLLLCLSGAARGNTVDVLVPAYANPCCAGGPGMWSSLIATAADPQRNFQLGVVFNPASGPGAGRDPNFLDAAGNGPLKSFLDAGGSAYGYVATTGATRPIAAVKADVDAYLTGQYAGYVKGIFFDEMSNNLADVGYYRELNAYVGARQPGAKTFGNPGTTFVNNPSGQTTYSAADYVGALGTIVSFESSGSDYASAYTSFPFLEGLDSRKIAHIVHTQATWNSSLIATAAGRGAGYLYVTDDLLVPNPYDKLASYWPQFANDVSAFNASAVPEPSVASLLVASLGLLALRRRFRRAAGSGRARTAFSSNN